MKRLHRCLTCSNAAIRSSSRLASTTTRNFPKIEIKNSPYQHGHHRSNAEELINKVPVIEVDGTRAVCDGGGGALGHPIEYIQLNLINAGESNVCKYCGLRFRSKHAH